MKKYIKFLSFVIVAVTFSNCGSSGGGDGSDPQDPPVAKVDPPKVAALVFPLNNTECNVGTVLTDDESSVEFEWNSAEFATSYTVVYTNLSTNETKETSTSEVKIPLTIQRGTPYSWKVISKGTGTNETAESDVWKFYNAGIAVENYAPFPAELVSPLMGNLAAQDVDLEWKGLDVDNDITEYKVYLETANPPTVLLGTTTLQKVNASGLSASTVYYWKVVTYDGYGNVTNSPIFEFRTQ